MSTLIANELFLQWILFLGVLLVFAYGIIHALQMPIKSNPGWYTFFTIDVVPVGRKPNGSTAYAWFRWVEEKSEDEFLFGQGLIKTTTTWRLPGSADEYSLVEYYKDPYPYGGTFYGGTFPNKIDMTTGNWP